MRHFPVFVNLDGRRVIVSGAGETAVAKLRLLLKTEARIAVFGENAVPQVRQWAAEGSIVLTERPIAAGDALCAALLYAANDDPAEDARAARIGREAGALVNIVDNLEDSQFITPAIVDRDPVTVAIGTEGAAPVLARKIKADLEERLPASLGTLTRLGQAFRARAEMLGDSKKRRAFWTRFYFGAGDRALKAGGEEAVRQTLETLLTDEIERRDGPGSVVFVGAGPGDPDLLTLKARNALHEADVVLHDRLVPQPILELARREAIIVETGKKGFGPAWTQDAINALMIEHASAGARVVRLKSGDPAVFGRLEEELDALDEAGITFDIVPGITSASAAVASIGRSLTRRGRNASLRIITGHDAEGFADHDWRALARPGEAAAIYMGLKASAFLRGRLLMHGADAETPVTVVENASRADQRIVAATLGDLPETLADAGITGPAVLLYGIAPRGAQVAMDALPARAEAV
ncbi:MAG: siroheme synthase CysG [Roseitalea porphyridii]|jgi:uroporphyrin-III C-methyltransferase/precorrin-2 dehydrogenase/sirohydrochlorin ferrochelatase|uniref:siroheme synthase CysG n=1 Tax=Hyphomicrobiales TaxID=356 RepID=UPI0032EFBAA5